MNVQGMEVREDRFWSKVDKSGDCWLWTGARAGGRYGHFGVRAGKTKTQRLAHRIAYALSGRNLIDGMIIDHMCHNIVCVNPDHLRQVTHKQSVEHMGGARKDSKTGVLGVSPASKWGKPFVAQVKHNRKSIYVGSFDTIEEAEAAVIAKRNELFTHNDMDRTA